jgi:hypothetical protein
LSTPKPPPATINETDIEIGMDENMKLSPVQWAPWISDPDPPEEPMTPEQSKAAQIREKLIDEMLREEVINELLRDHPTLTREEAEEEVDAFL